MQLAPGVAEVLAPRLGTTPDTIQELALDLTAWPDDVSTVSRRGRDGRLIAGDPLLVAVSQEGLYFATWRNCVVLVRWTQVRGVRVLGSIRRTHRA